MSVREVLSGQNPGCSHSLSFLAVVVQSTAGFWLDIGSDIYLKLRAPSLISMDPFPQAKGLAPNIHIGEGGRCFIYVSKHQRGP